MTSTRPMTGRGRPGWAALVVAAMVIAGSATVLYASPAAAHNSTSTYWRYIYNDGRQCILAGNQQNHGRPISSLGRYASTLSLINPGCQSYPQPAGRIAQRGNVYIDGRLCQSGGWQYSAPPAGQATTAILEWSTDENLAGPCGVGYITHDVYHAVWNPWAWTAIYANATPFPSTGHDYRIR